MDKTYTFTEGKLLSPMIKFTIPIFGALFLQTMYGAVDMMVIGQFAGAADVSAVSTGSWLMQLVTSFVVGIAMGTTILLGRKIGENKAREAGKIIGSSIGLFIILAVLITFFMELFTCPIVAIIQTPSEAVKATTLYVRICSAGAIFIIAYNVLGSIFRGIGDSKMPLISVAIACVCNIIAGYVLVGICNLATAGAAIATVASQALSVILSLWVIKKRTFPFEFHPSDISFKLKPMVEIFKLGLPIAFQDLLVGISFLTITAIVNSLGVIISAGVGVAEKLCGFIMLAPSAFSQAMASIVAQNMGANQPRRAKKAMAYGISCSLTIGVVMAYFAFFHGNLLAGIFAKDHDVVLAAWQYLKAYAIDTLLVSVMFCMTGYFNGCGQTFFVMSQGIIGAFAVRIPVSYIMSKIQPISVFRIGLATPCSTFVQIILCVCFFWWLNRPKNKNNPNA